MVENLRRWIRERTDKNELIYEIHHGPTPFVITETTEAGRAELECAIPAGYSCAVFHLHGKDGLFGFLGGKENADGAALFVRPGGAIVAWIVECKTTVDQRKWGNIVAQFRWTLGRLRAVAGVLGAEIADVSLATAFRTDRLSEDESPNPASGKALIGSTNLEVSEDGVDWARREQLSWINDEVEIPGIPGKLRHKKLRLDALGAGSCRLDS